MLHRMIHVRFLLLVGGQRRLKVGELTESYCASVVKLPIIGRSHTSDAGKVASKTSSRIIVD